VSVVVVLGVVVLCTLPTPPSYGGGKSVIIRKIKHLLGSIFILNKIRCFCGATVAAGMRVTRRVREKER
jgi:hypothetical protein